MKSITKNSSGIIYRDILFIHELSEEDGLLCFAQWSYEDQRIEIFTGTWKQDCDTEQEYIDRLFQVINHEVLHSVIEYASNGEITDNHYPFRHGFDDVWLADQR